MKHFSQRLAQIRYGLLLVLALFLIQYLLFWGGFLLDKALLTNQPALLRALIRSGIVGCQLKLSSVLQHRLEDRYPKHTCWSAVTWEIFVLAGVAVVLTAVLYC